MSAAGSVFFAAHAWNTMHEYSTLVLREPALRASTEKDKAQIQIEADVEKLRALAIKHSDSRLAEWKDYCYRLHELSETLLWASAGLATASVVLGYSIYGLRIYKPVA